MLNRKKQQTDETDTFAARKLADETRHLESCNVCREKLRPREDQKLYAVKNGRTRQFLHVLVNGKSLEDTLGWPKGEILYAILKEDGAPKGSPMSEEVKVKLREAAEKRKADNELKRMVRANTPARLVEGGEEKKGEREMKTKKKAKVKAKRKKTTATATIVRSLKEGGFETQLPNEFFRKYKGVDYKVAKIGDGWQVNGGKTMTIHEAKDFILAQHKSAGKDWTAGVFFLKNRQR